MFSEFSSKFKKKEKPKQPPSYDEDNTERMWYDRGKASLRDKILLDRRLRFFVVMFFAAVVAPVLLYIYLFQDQLVGGPQLQTCLVRDEYRVPCFPGQDDVTKAMCNRAACCFNSSTGECHHMLPSSYGFKIQGWTNVVDTLATALSSVVSLKPLTDYTTFGSQSIPSVKFVLKIEDPTHLRITFAHTDMNLSANGSSLDLETSQFNVLLYGPEFFLDVYRRSSVDTGNQSLIFTTSRGPVIASTEYSEITIEFSRKSVIYGLGRLSPNADKGSPRTLYNNRDRTGSHPVLISIDEYGSFNALFIESAGPMEFEVYEKSNLVILRTLLNARYDIHVFAGPTPRDVMNQLTNVIGKPKLPPYWALGFHVCPDLDNDDVCNNFELFMNRSLEEGIPWDSHCIDNSMITNRLFFNTGKICEPNSPVWNDVQLTSRKLLLTLPVPVPSNLSASGGVFVKNPNGSEYLGIYKLAPVIYPDFFDESSGEWLRNHVSSLVSDIPSDNIGGYLLQNNWPENEYREGTGEDLDYLPQEVNGYLSNNTIWWDARHSGNKTHLSLHKVYGLEHTRRLTSYLASDNIVLSTASYPGLGTLGGCYSHPSVDVEVSWSSLKEAYSNIIGLGLSGINLAGSPICGNDPKFDQDVHEEICLRWYQLAGLSPFMRVSSGPKFRDPLSLSNSSLFNIRRVLQLRYKILPYLYTQFEEASKTGMPVVRPMSFEFPEDSGTWNLQSQYMLGSSLLVAPSLDAGVVSLPVYLPKINGTWYFLEGGQAINNGTGGYTKMIPVTRIQAILLLRPGVAILMHEGGLSTYEALQGNYSLAIGLICEQDKRNCSAACSVSLPKIGKMNLEITADNTSLTISNIENSDQIKSLTSLKVYGLVLSVKEFYVPVYLSAMPGCSNYAALEAQYDSNTNVMLIGGFDLSTCSGTISRLEITW
ncbi:lysosomal alpha-glucosidase [Anabrus simplex]|uniref:lysosomal alpha-glucosidase n=1 Tax=Anabrus simplex TaxID=316456 RepID=UPI0035A30F14